MILSLQNLKNNWGRGNKEEEFRKDLEASWEPSVSVVMPALNVGKFLDEVFNGIDHISYPKEKIEIILVDNGSVDNTAAISRSRGAIVIGAPGAKLGELRNIGSQIAKGEILCFLDSDCIVDPLWIKNAIMYLQCEKVGAVGCHTRIGKKSTWVEKTLDFHATKEGVNEVNYLPTANMFIKKDLFKKIGGFNNNLETGEDSDFCHKIKELGLKIISDTKIRVIHKGYPKTIMELFRKERWHFREVFYLLRRTNFGSEYILAIGIPLIYQLILLAGGIFLLLAILEKEVILFIISILLAQSIPFLLALYKAVNKGKISHLLYSTAYFSIVLMARNFTIYETIMRTIHPGKS